MCGGGTVCPLLVGGEREGQGRFARWIRSVVTFGGTEYAAYGVVGWPLTYNNS